jgi:hypothetical protein
VEVGGAHSCTRNWSGAPCTIFSGSVSCHGTRKGRSSADIAIQLTQGIGLRPSALGYVLSALRAAKTPSPSSLARLSASLVVVEGLEFQRHLKVVGRQGCRRSQGRYALSGPASLPRQPVSRWQRPAGGQTSPKVGSFAPASRSFRSTGGLLRPASELLRPAGLLLTPASRSFHPASGPFRPAGLLLGRSGLSFRSEGDPFRSAGHPLRSADEL